MDLEAITAQLRAEEHAATARLEEALTGSRTAGDEGVPDTADQGVQTNILDGHLRSAEAARTHLDEVRAAIGRVEAGTYGLCVVDGEPIEEARLQAVPWAAYCLRHQALREAGAQSRRNTL